MGELARIGTLEQFRSRVAEGRGVIVITDFAREEPIAHLSSCSFITEDAFTEKVIENAGASGDYFWFADPASAEEALSARPCGHCF